MIYLKALIIWFFIILAETLHGAARTLFLAPLVGDFTARQVSVFTGAVIILFIAALFVRWLHAANIYQLLGVGLLWLSLTVTFEIVLGRLVFKYSWQRILSDYDVLHGGFLPIGLLVLVLAPLITVKVSSFV
ncbi:hypothetical protein DSM106972_038700 [Dulcicalothrix desertica PCC 7102]|uniref:Uncharacterized protein n=1 Tax=Dulcicalothrix desertica PCC 7102 TaxID=232991 RepID=A0A3S1ANC4_9CYAN|nr:hypothetical protein [Dulcicalothrix desertica]RUT05049.1 hypothetical protein DSM106972_038700 [Dulcicalothrix desertica PCC 7102]TWH62590.1 hypothetical protein CAL7102_00083 [Dulcicalothrix desertica PCC 7102]